MRKRSRQVFSMSTCHTSFGCDFHNLLFSHALAFHQKKMFYILKTLFERVDCLNFPSGNSEVHAIVGARVCGGLSGPGAHFRRLPHQIAKAGPLHTCLQSPQTTIHLRHSCKCACSVNVFNLSASPVSTVRHQP